MCSRYSLTSPPEAVRATFAYRDTPNFPARYNIAPTQEIGVVCVDPDGTRRFRMMRWGLLPPFVRDPKAGLPMINARDIAILDILQRDSDTSLSEMGQKVHLSPSACSRRIAQYLFSHEQPLLHGERPVVAFNNERRPSSVAFRPPAVFLENPLGCM